jgi:hypothetical protein
MEEGGDVVDKGYQPKFGPYIYSHILLFSLVRRGALLKKTNVLGNLQHLYVEQVACLFNFRH